MVIGPIELPPHTQGLIVLTIPSSGGGSDLWGVEEEEREVMAKSKREQESRAKALQERERKRER